MSTPDPKYLSDYRSTLRGQLHWVTGRIATTGVVDKEKDVLRLLQAYIHEAVEYSRRADATTKELERRRLKIHRIAMSLYLSALDKDR